METPDAAYVKDVARSWLTAAELTETSSTPAQVYGYDMPQKAYLVDFAGVAETSSVTLKLDASSKSPMVNPAILINNWGSALPIMEINNVLLELLAKLSPVGGKISNSHPADANEYYSRVLPKAVASFFSNRRGKAQIQRKGSHNTTAMACFP